MLKGKLIVFSAPSGSGKTTLVKDLLNRNTLALDFSVSATSRAPRANEKEGIDYYFMSPEKFRRCINANLFVEYEEVYDGLYYGTLKTEIERIWSINKSVIFDLDVVGGLNIKRQYPLETLAVFVKPPSVEELKNRLLKRGTETEATIKERLEKASQEIEMADKFDIVIENTDVEKAKREAYELVFSFLKS